MSGRRPFGLGVALTAAWCFAAPVYAQSVQPDQPTSLSFDVTMTIKPRCGWSASGAPPAQVNLGSLDASGTTDIPFEVDCNTPFLFTAVSERGSLQRDELIETLPETFTQNVDYRVNLRMGVRQPNGAAETLVANCRSSNLRFESSCPIAPYSVNGSSFTGDAIAPAADTSLSRSRLRVTWDGPSEGGPTRVAGSYSDVLTVSVQAKS